MRCFVYCRVSSEEQATDNNYSLENQERRADDLIAAKGWRIAKARKDVASGKSANREGYRELLDSIKNETIDCVVVYRLDRLSRNVRDIYDFLDLIARYNVAFISLSEGFDTTTAMGRAMLGVAAVFAQLTREMIAENVKDGLMRRAQAGLYLGRQSGPFGYRYSKESNMIEVAPEEAEIIRQIFQLYAERKWGFKKITGYLNEERIGTRIGSQWNVARIHHIVRNPVYIGKVRWHDEVFDGQHEPILQQDMWDAAQELLGSRKQLPHKSQQSEHLLSGIGVCGLCGKRMVAHYGPKKKDGSRYVSYSHRTHGKRDECKPFHKSAPKLEMVVLAEIKTLAESGVMERIAHEELLERLESTSAPLRDRRQAIISELSDLRSNFSAWADRLDRKLVTEVQFIEHNRKLVEREAWLEEELGKIDIQLAQNENVEVSLEVAREALREFPKVWDQLEIQERREFLRNLIERLEVYADKAVLKLMFLPEVTIAI